MNAGGPIAALAMLAFVATPGFSAGQTAPRAQVVVKTGEQVPLPRPRPQAAKSAEALGFEEAIAGLDLDPATITSEPSECDRRLAEIAVVSLKPRLVGPGACGGAEMVELEAVLLPDKSRVAIKPVPLLQCRMAESLAAWVRDEVAARVAALGSPLRALENYDAYRCRTRNNVAGAKISEHGKGNALDVRAFVLADGRRLVLTDAEADKPLREALRDSACRRFTTVLGPGADAHHESHIHLDVIQRARGYRICQWDVREPKPAVPLPVPRPAARIAAASAAGAPAGADAPAGAGSRERAAASDPEPAAAKPAAKPEAVETAPKGGREPVKADTAPKGGQSPEAADTAPKGRQAPVAAAPEPALREPARLAGVAVPLPPRKPAKRSQIRRKSRKSPYPFHFPFTLWR